ncbi:YcfL family protein [Celerinatantimonas yamalensis]|uniref:DUF1425 domain-containing protein n=1 Tax=Celerinatantimonas yamalensis TaxID=559956 RepID=A0ABW9G3C3_9GAMM
MRRHILAVSAALMMLSGCATYSAGVGTPVIAATDMPNQLVQSDNSLLARKLTFTHAGIKARSDGRQQAFITLQSTSNYDQNLQYRFYWYDASGQQLAQTPWLAVMLHGKETKQLHSISQSTKASAFRVYIRQAD